MNATKAASGAASENDATGATGRAASETHGGRIAGKLFDTWKAVRAATTRHNDDPEPKPSSRRRREGTGGTAFTAAAQMFARVSRDLQSIFGRADAEPETHALLDAANPYWDCSLDAESGSDFKADRSDYSAAPSLDL